MALNSKRKKQEKRQMISPLALRFWIKVDYWLEAPAALVVVGALPFTPCLKKSSFASGRAISLG